MSDLCNGDLDAPIRLEVWDYDFASSDDEIGNIEVTVRKLLSKQPIELKDYKEGRNLKCGSIQCDNANVVCVCAGCPEANLGRCGRVQVWVWCAWRRVA